MMAPYFPVVWFDFQGELISGLLVWGVFFPSNDFMTAQHLGFLTRVTGHSAFRKQNRGATGLLWPCT